MTAADQEVAEREVNILATFSHPFIVRYKRAFVRQGQLCIVMEHAEGGDLTQHMEQLIAAGQRPGLTQVLDWFVQLLFALKYIHGYKVLHRDLALKNIFLASDGFVKLGDFGVARVLASSSDLALTRVGTPCNISPERCEGKPYSFESDVWALGCILFELLVTRPAFSAETIPLLTEKILTAQYSQILPEDGIAPETLNLIERIFQVLPEQRPSITELLSEPILAPSLARHEAADREATCDGRIVSVEIPLLGYEGASKTTFSQRPIFVEGGERIVDEGAISKHDEKLIGIRSRRQRQINDRRGASGSASYGNSSLSFDKVQNFGSAGVLTFLKRAQSQPGSSSSNPT
uniref:non-specific serine/threonine protein kinase n=1 Tax=Haptolina ericina TaxID=156174 RepID=A0A7S3C3D9_9EUKA